MRVIDWIGLGKVFQFSRDILEGTDLHFIGWDYLSQKRAVLLLQFSRLLIKFLEFLKESESKKHCNRLL